ncbi:MAG: ABC transporter permease [Armatimonadetes bacterium]|nr:ABC transporter permease [Armatimonadota bacterium]
MSKFENVNIVLLPKVSFWKRWILPIFVIAQLTIKEATRRWAFIGGLILGAGMMMLLAYVFANVRRQGEFLPAEIQASLIVHFGLVMTRFFSAVMATVLACGAIATELERGTLTLVVTKPIRRWQIVMGKWLGFAFVLTINQLIWLVVIEWGAWNRLGQWHWGVWKAGAIGLLYPLIFLSLNLFLSVHLPWIFVALISFVFAGIGWSETAMRNIGILANLPRLLTLSQIAGYLMPTGKLARWMVVESEVLDIVPRLSGPPGIEMPTPTVGDLIYVVAYIFVLLLMAFWLFGRKEIAN